MNRQDASRIVAVIIAACPSQSARLDGGRVASMIDAFAGLLGDLTYEQVNAAVSALLQTSPFMPAVADIRARVLELERGPVLAGGEAWSSVQAAMKREGSYRTPGVEFAFRDETTARCVAAMGWRELCLSENTVADRARFIDLYDELAVQSRREQQSPMLAAAREKREALSAGEAIRRLSLVASGEVES